MISPLINQWAIRWGISYAALADLEEVFGLKMLTHMESPGPVSHSESYVQSCVRLEAARKGLKLWRNNVGALADERGIPVRYGLGNDSPALNKRIKSGDLIGWRPLVITPSLIGVKVAQFVSRECKRPDWKYTGNDRESAQLRWAEAVNADGGDAAFCTGEGTL